jgi:acetyl esterase/lipase
MTREASHPLIERGLRKLTYAASLVLICACAAGGQQARSSGAGATTRERAREQADTDQNVIYGMYSGLALLMDVYHPVKPNGFGVILIPGSGWTAQTTYDATPLKSSEDADVFIPPLVEAGYTLFVIDHRATPRFPWPAQLLDAQRAVRFIRFHAGDYGIDPNNIGAVGYSTGAHLAAMLGVLEGIGDPEDPDVVNQLSARVQCVVAGAIPADLTYRKRQEDRDAEFGVAMVFLTMFLEEPVFGEEKEGSDVWRRLKKASPITYVEPGDPPMLFFHGDRDELMPIEQAQEMDETLKKAGVPEKFVVLHGAGHDLVGKVPQKDYFPQIIAWLDQYLKDAAKK